jgi:hypothetical protein
MKESMPSALRLVAEIRFSKAASSGFKSIIFSTIATEVTVVDPANVAKSLVGGFKPSISKFYSITWLPCLIYR